ncbi:MAG TPA: ABC transporter ATP-binding protein [Bryobacteraceae bacterium]|nr:ABC transporter ATP-binding protein [Bryobacteraceae bacterium]
MITHPNVSQASAPAQDSVAADAPAPNGAPPVIELNALCVRLAGREVLSNLTGTFSGRTIGLLGPNGAGKSTLINTLLGFWPVSSGSARVFGSDIQADVKKIRALIGYMPENDAFISKMSAVSFIRFMAELSGLPSALALERAHEALFYVGLGEARYRKLGTYSLGMKQLAKLAQAIAHGPKLLILDEPTNGLDPPARQRMIRLVKEMRDSREMHIILCSHLLRDVEETCEEVVILKQGRVVHYSNLEKERRSNRRFVELEPRGDVDAFLEGVAKLGCEYAPGALNRVKLVLAENVEVQDIYRIAAEHKVQLRRLNFRRDTLEDIFLKAMENTDGRL